MTTASPLRPSRSLVGAEVLKLRTRRGLVTVTALLTVGAMVFTYAIMALLHRVDPSAHGPAGGIDNLGHGAWLTTALGSVAATIVAATAGAGDLESGIYRDLVVTGRSRVHLYASKIPGGLLFVLPFALAAYGVTALAARVLAGDRPVPGVHDLVATGLWVLLQVVFYYLLALAIACLLGSRAYTIGIVLAWRLALTPILAAVTSLGVVRELVPGVALQALAPKAVEVTARQGADVPMSSAAIGSCLIVWTLAAVTAGGWRESTRDA